ncbi:Phospholipase D1, partial [Dissostichus eleginoides]
TDTGVSVMSPSHAPSREAALGNKGNGFNQEVVDRHTDRLRPLLFFSRHPDLQAAATSAWPHCTPEAEIQ